MLFFLRKITKMLRIPIRPNAYDQVRNVTVATNQYRQKHRDRLLKLNNRSKEKRQFLKNDVSTQVLLSQQGTLLHQVPTDLVATTKVFHEAIKVGYGSVETSRLRDILIETDNDPYQEEELYRLRRANNYFLTLQYVLNRSPIFFDRWGEEYFQQLSGLLQLHLSNRFNQYRNYGLHDPIGHRLVEVNEIPDALLELAEWHGNECRSLEQFNSVPHAAQVYLRFLAINPFLNDNHKIAQILMSSILDHRGYPPVIFTNLPQYENAIDKAFNGHPEAFYDFVLERIETKL